MAFPFCCSIAASAGPGVLNAMLVQ